MANDPRWPTVDSLGPLTILGSGGEAEVFAIANDPSRVVKIFKQTLRRELHAEGLMRTIDLLNQFTTTEREILATSTVWPQLPVREQDALVGFIMPRIDESYLFTYGRREELGAEIGMARTLRTWSHLSYRDVAFSREAIVTDMPNLSLPSERTTLVELMRRLSQVFEILHGKNVVVGDGSGNNILWRAKPTVEVLVIDCDGFRVAGERAVTAAKQSPDWFDPELKGATNIESDRYKLALAVYRGFFSKGLEVPHSSEVADDFDRRVLEYAIRGTTTGDRPTAQEWRILFDTYVAEEEKRAREKRLEGRGRLSWEKDDGESIRLEAGPGPSPGRSNLNWRT